MALLVEAAALVSAGLDAHEARRWVEPVNALITTQPPTDAWQTLVRDYLRPQHPFALHRLLFDTVYREWDVAQHGPPPAWLPQASDIAESNIGACLAKLALPDFAALHQWSVTDRPAFWAWAVETLGIRFSRPPTQVLDMEGDRGQRWLVGAQLNIATSCFMAPPDALAIVSLRADGSWQRVSYGDLERLTCRVHAGLSAIGLGPGARIAVDMPMTVESVAIYLGIVRAGATCVSIADSFAPDEIATRLRIADATAIFTQDVILRSGKRLPMYSKVRDAGAPRAIVLRSRGDGEQPIALRDGDLDWDEFLAAANGTPAAHVANPDDMTNILFSSGTTGDPKAIPWTHTTPIRCAIDGFIHGDIRSGDVVAWPTNFGWMMGPWLTYAALVNHATIALYEGAPTGRDFGDFVANAKVTFLGLVPSLVKAWRESDCMRGVDWRALRLFASTGECSNADDYLFLMSLAGYRPVIEYCGGTEIGGSYITGTVVQPASPATFSTPTIGHRLHILDEAGKPTNVGEVFLETPSLGLSERLLNRDHDSVYFEGVPSGPDNATLRRHGDELERLAAGYYCAHGRADDTMNLGGIKVSSAEIERTCLAHAGIREAAAVAVEPPGGGPSRLVIYAVRAASESAKPDELLAQLQSAIKFHLNPLFKIADVILVDALPRTASGKVMRRLLRAGYGESSGV